MYFERIIKIGYWIALTCWGIAISASIASILVKEVTQCSDRAIKSEQGFGLIALSPVYFGAICVLAFYNARSERFQSKLREAPEFMLEPVFMCRNMLITHAHIPIISFCIAAFFAPSMALWLLYLVLTRCAHLHF